ncbi:MAG: hypothetical protein H0V23_13910 [Nocardioidaceae bacterium]|nr:hypothetical protein [Nocardioidaceae bacterium]
MPTEEVAGFEQRLPGMTAGQGVLFSEPVGYEPVHGVPPSRGAGVTRPPSPPRP